MALRGATPRVTDGSATAGLGGRPVARIDRNGPAPFYHQQNEILLSDIGSSWWSGDKLPSESELCAQYGVSRTVVRQALDEMEREGLVYKIKGKGAFVTGRKFESTFVQHAAGFHASMAGRGHAVSSEILLQEVVPARPHVARMLGLDVGEPVLALDRVRSVDGIRIQVVRAWLPHRLCRGLEGVYLGDASLYEILETRYGLRPHHGWRAIEAVPITAGDATLLGVQPGSPGLLVDSLTSTAEDVLFEYFVAVYRGDRSRFDIEVRAP